ncbi:MAG TPA: penicillin-binding transpeptidase domain-containing protein [Ktedonosporobacter sp.]|nr:penicillin-binding transpeptidase domain-containing protein [Ktedonosporobacter sp.]
MNISTNIRKLTLLFVTFFIALSGGLVYWQVVVAQRVTQNIHNGRPCLPDSAPDRGRIFDRNGVLLADSKPSTTGCGSIRHYYEPSLAGLIGYYAGPNYPSTGIEHLYDDYLSGRAGITALQNTVNQTLHRPPVGDDIYLTIDVRIQRLVNQHFDDPINIDNFLTFASDRGSVVVSDPHTGGILAMLSRPSFDPNKLVSTLQSGDQAYFNQLVHDPEQPLLERPLNALYPPGSTYKTVTLMAGLDSGKVNLNDQFDQQHAIGPIFVNGQPIGPIGNNLQPYTIRFPVTTEYGFAHSDNVIFAQVGLKTGQSTWLDYNNRFFLGQQQNHFVDRDLPFTPSSVQTNGQPLSDNELAANAFGQGIDNISPMQMSLFDNVVANDGQLMKPMLVSQITDRTKNPLQVNQSQATGSAVSSQTATQVRQAMFGVVRCGSGLLVTDLFTSTSAIIGKTGTAELGGKLNADGWLITQAPYSVNNPTQLPALTIIAMKENAGEGGLAVGPMVAHIYNDIFANGYVKVQVPTPPGQSYCCTTQLLQQGCVAP